MRSRIALSAAFAVAVYGVLSTAFGASGVAATAEASTLVRAMEANVSALEAERAELEARVLRAADDREELRLGGRELGLVGRGETVVRLPGGKPASPIPGSGAMVAWIPPAGVADADLKLAALGAGLAVHIASLALSRGRVDSGRGRHPAATAPLGAVGRSA